MSTRVICFGNSLHGDDGFGQHVFARLPADIEAYDAGVAGLNALAYFEGCAKVVVVDAVRTGARVGIVHRLTDLEAPGGELSLHAFGVSAILGALTDPPDVVVIGAEAGELRMFTRELSPPVAAAVPVAVHMVLHECSVDAPAGV